MESAVDSSEEGTVQPSSPLRNQLRDLEGETQFDGEPKIQDGKPDQEYRSHHTQT